MFKCCFYIIIHPKVIKKSQAVPILEHCLIGFVTTLTTVQWHFFFEIVLPDVLGQDKKVQHQRTTYNTEKCKNCEIRFTRKIIQFERDFQVLIPRAARIAHQFCKPKSSCFLRETDVTFCAFFDIVCGLLETRGVCLELHGSVNTKEIYSSVRNQDPRNFPPNSITFPVLDIFPKARNPIFIRQYFLAKAACQKIPVPTQKNQYRWLDWVCSGTRYLVILQISGALTETLFSLKWSLSSIYHATIFKKNFWCKYKTTVVPLNSRNF